MKQILITVFCLGLCGLYFACASKQENIAASNSEQNAPLTQGSVETMPTPEPTPSPLTDDHSKRRDEIHSLMLKGERLHDGSLELEHIGDISSVPALLVVLKEYPPDKGGGMPCVTDHALVALRKITGANPGIRYKDWSAWWEKYQKKQKAKEK
jgi:hypothetical protein